MTNLQKRDKEIDYLLNEIDDAKREAEHARIKEERALNALTKLNVMIKGD